jgi:polyphosphate kinase 2 (PPK2 family)
MDDLPDGSYEAMVLDLRRHPDDDVVRIDLVITTGAHKGDVVVVRSPGIAEDPLLMGLPGTLTVEGGEPRLRLDDGGSSTPLGPYGPEPGAGARHPRLDALDLSAHLSRAQEAARLTAAQQRLLQLRLVLGGQVPAATGESARIGPPVCVVFEGWDASGKGGAIKRLVGGLDPRHVRVAQFAVPTYDEKRHHYLWRFWPALPGWGGMAVFDRSWYGRVLVERVEQLATEEQWQRAYGEIVEFERTLAAEGMILVKFWLHISDEEQLRRFERRQADPLKSWKLTAEDRRNRERRADYEAAVEDMVGRTDHPAAGWTLVEANSKRWARVRVVEHTCEAVEAGMRARGWTVPAPLEPPVDDG